MTTFDEWWASSGAQPGGLVYRLAASAYAAGLVARAPETVDGEVERVRVELRRLLAVGWFMCKVRPRVLARGGAGRRAKEGPWHCGLCDLPPLHRRA